MRTAALALAALFAAGPALAATPVTLKADTVDADGMVTLADLFDGAGQAGQVRLAARPGQTVSLDARIVQQIAWRSGLEWANAEGVKRILVRGPAQGPAAIAGAPAGNVEVLTYARSLAAGEIVQPQDLVFAKMAAAPADAATDAEQVIGLAARRPLRAGAAVQARDVAAAQVVKPGELITVTYEDTGISLAMQAKALAGGAAGEPISVQNPASKKILQAVVTGPGQAVVGPAADQLRSLRSTRIALR
ncbi:flagellar basal body P-ring formation chaperone FlgA [Phenylobacterium sp. J367]|uniref:flagellar basal body P-ring formation chaperone FlgA n=1 Tax=Phenylobacterium sp. J367 TaxID=2898435 RepID=UPI0021518D73|nr:flagellar basal body P-ring formation chaperone FlgA [Phenylobacterium sp. J367]MCR5879070.1 flagellar basal body P-ring formation chaperone FlgA [Phenylobacterium sp. J367]